MGRREAVRQVPEAVSRPRSGKGLGRAAYRRSEHGAKKKRSPKKEKDALDAEISSARGIQNPVIETREFPQIRAPKALRICHTGVSRASAAQQQRPSRGGRSNRRAKRQQQRA